MKSAQENRDLARKELKRDHKRAERKRNRDSGWVPVNVWICATNMEKLRKAEKRLQKP